MILVRLKFSSRLVALDPRTPAVHAESYERFDEGQHGITRGKIADADIEPLGVFKKGVLIFVESDDVDDVLDPSGAASRDLTRIWWKATVLGGAVRGGRA